MFELTETIDIVELEGGNNNEQISETIKGGFPRIKICDKEFIKKINERKPTTAFIIGKRKAKKNNK
jgi:hypothetical protein